MKKSPYFPSKIKIETKVPPNAIKIRNVKSPYHA
jgi:hypothetical protein